SRVQFPGLFWDEEARDTIGKFGAIKSMLANVAARRYLIESFVEESPSENQTLLAKAVSAEALGSMPGSITYDACQVFGGTGYSEDDTLSKFFRDASLWRFIGAENAATFRQHGRDLIDSDSQNPLSTVPDEASVVARIQRHVTLEAELTKV